jgi:putative sterol carrier protein
MVDEELKEKMKDKIQGGSFNPESDMKEYLQLFAQICNESSEIKDEVDGFNRKFQFKLEGTEDVWMKITDAQFELGDGQVEDPDIVLTMHSRTAAGIFTGEIDATSAYMSGDLKVQGPLPDAVKFRTITELVREALD